MIIHTQYLSMKMYLVVEVLSMTMMKKFITNSVEIKIVGYERKTTQASCKNPELKLIWRSETQLEKIEKESHC